MAAVIIHSDFGAQENKVYHCFHFSPIYVPWSNGIVSHDLSFFEWVLSQLFHSPFTFIKKLFSASLFSAIGVVSSAYLRLLKFLLAILIPVCASSSPAFRTQPSISHPAQYFTYKLNKQSDIIQSWVRKGIYCPHSNSGSIPGFGKTPWRRKWQLTPVFLPGESHG